MPRIPRDSIRVNREQSPTDDPHDRARQAVRDALARVRQDAAWLAREAEIDGGTVSDFLAGNRWPRLSTLAKLDAALGWSPGTIDRLARGADSAVHASSDYSVHVGAMEADGLHAMLQAIEGQLEGATQAWTEAALNLQDARIAARAAEDRRAQLVLDHARLTQRLEQIRLQEGQDDEGERPTR